MPLEDSIYEQILDEFGFDPDYAVKCIEANRHNNITATYHLLYKRALRQRKPFTNASPKRENLVYKHEKYATRAEHSKEVVAYGHDVKTVALKSNFHGDLQELDEKVISMMEKTDNKNVHGQPIYQCTLCGKEGKNGQLKNHIEANHLEGVSIPCNLCQIMFRSKRGLTTHIYENHRNI